MGIFDDAQFNPAYFNGKQSPGLLTYLLEALKAKAGVPDEQPQFTPTQGGAGDRLVPTAPGPEPQRELPNAQFAQAQQPQMPPPPPVQVQAPAGLPGAFQGLLANAHTGPIGALLGAIAGGVGMAPINPQAVMMAEMQALAREPGMTQAKLFALMQDPTLRKQYFSGAIQTLPDGTMVNVNSMRGPSGTVTPIYQGPVKGEKMGPGDNLVNPVTGAQLGQPNTAGQLSPEAKEYFAGVANAGQDKIYANMGRTAIGGLNVAAVKQAQFEQAKRLGITPAQLAARQAEYGGYEKAVETAAGRLGNVSLSVNELDNLAPQALAASAALPRSQLKPVNELMQSFQTRTGNPQVVSLGAALYGIVHVYARTVNPQGVAAESDIKHATEILDQALSHGQLEAGINQLKVEAKAMAQAPGQVREELRKGFLEGVEGKQYPAKAVQALKTDPRLREQFDAKYGPGAAAKVLGQ